MVFEKNYRSLTLCTNSLSIMHIKTELYAGQNLDIKLHILDNKLDSDLVDIFHCFVYEFCIKTRNKNQPNF